jgi:hypothetical protein
MKDATRLGDAYVLACHRDGYIQAPTAASTQTQRLAASALASKKEKEKE